MDALVDWDTRFNAVCPTRTFKVHCEPSKAQVSVVKSRIDIKKNASSLLGYSCCQHAVYVLQGKCRISFAKHGNKC